MTIRRTSLRFACTWAIVVLVLSFSGLAAGARTATGGGAFKASSGPLASCRSGSKPAIIAGNFKCLRVGDRCRVSYQASYRKYGFRCVAGHLRKRSAGGGTHESTPPPVAPPVTPPVAPPPPPGIPGHYKGLTSQSEDLEFDVTSDGRGVIGFKTGQINQGCTPPAHIYGGYLNFGTYTMPLRADGSFSLTYTEQATVGSNPATGTVSVSGHLNGSVAIGNVERKTAFTENGTSYSCGSGLQTWTATRTG